MVNGPLGELAQEVPARMKIEQSDGQVVVTRPTERGDDRALHGLTRTLIANMVEGVTKGFEKRLELQGVGYRASLQGTDLRLDVGYSHPVVLKAPQRISFEDIKKVDVLPGPIVVYAIRAKGGFVHFTNFFRHHQRLMKLVVDRAGLSPQRG